MNVMCSDCGVLLNQQAKRVDETARMAALEAPEANIGGANEEAHACPECGKTVLRKLVLETNKQRRGMIRRAPFAYRGIL
jgi:ssDNA-binding Zn-finger/Zn-ribbon topoisomerase 1